MDTGTGIAIAGVWVFAGMAMLSKHVSSSGAWTAMILAVLVTWGLS